MKGVIEQVDGADAWTRMSLANAGERPFGAGLAIRRDADAGGPRGV
jgi:hypothetical protein